MPAPRIALLAGASALLLAGCMQPGGSISPTQEGALVGGLVGAGLGAMAGGSNRPFNTAAGAVAGAIVGGAIGQQLERQAQELRGSMSGGVDVVNTGSELVVTMPQDILFAFDSDQLSPSLQGDLAALARSLQRYPDTTVDVIGHTDNVGSRTYNQELSTRRALRVADVLLANGVARSRLRAYGLGMTNPVASNATDEGRARNRRVEIIIRPMA